MKLLLCQSCEDVVKMKVGTTKCQCGSSGARLGMDGLYAKYWGDQAVPLGFANRTLISAMGRRDRDDGMGVEFTAFVIPSGCDTCVKVDPPEIEEDNG